MVRQVTTRAGDTLFIVERHELEAAPGWKTTHGGRKGRGACVMHGGDNPAAMQVNFDTGWIDCYTHGCRGRLADHPDTRAGAGRPTVGAHRAQPAAAPKSKPRPAPDADRLARLEAALAAGVARLDGSAGAAYLEARGIPTDLARAHGIGWGDPARKLRGRVVFPLSDPAGVVTSATGRTTSAGAKPKYWTLPADEYPKGWFNGGAVAVAAAEGLPLYLCEGPFDALAMLAGGIHTAAAVLGVTGVRVGWLAGVRRVVVCLDADDAGQKARGELAFAAAAVGAAVELMPAGALGDCKDISEHWERHGALPAALLAHWEEAQRAAAIPEPGPCRGT